MKKIVFSVVLAIAFISISYAQSPNYKWAKAFGSANSSVSSRKVGVDASGNVYTAGIFQGTVDFDPGTAVSNLTASGTDGIEDIFISKLDANGNFVWVKRIGAADYMETVLDMKVDASGNIYVVGSFETTVDFNPGSGVNNLICQGYVDGYVLKMNTSGTFVWAKSIGGVNYDNMQAVDIDVAGNVFVTGRFSLTVDLNPGTGVANFTANSSLASQTGDLSDMYILKLDVSGNYVWAKQINGNTEEIPFSIKVDAAGNVYTTGWYYGTTDFDPGSSSVNFSASGSWYDAFILKLDGSGNYIWAKSLVGNEASVGNSIDVDNSGNVYVAGDFSGTVDFNPSTSGSYSLTSVGNDSSKDIFLLKLNSSGNYQWVKRVWGAGYDVAQGMKVDPQGNSFITGTFSEIADFDPSSAGFNLTAAGGSAFNDVYLWKLDAAGNFSWAAKVGGGGLDDGFDVAYDATYGSIHFTGVFTGTSDFDPSSAISNITSLGSNDAFVLKMCLPASGAGAITGNTTVVSGGTASYSVATVSGATGYTWTVPSGATITSGQGTNNINVTFGTTSGSVVVTPTNSCGNSQSTSQFVTIAGTCLATINISTTNTVICSGSAAFTSTITNGGAAPTYQWKKNGTNVGSNIPTYSPTSLVNGDVISCVLTSNSSCASPSVVTSNSITMTVSSSVTPSIVIATSSNTICTGSAVFTSSITNGGTAPSYQWKKNGTNVGSNIPTYSPTSLVNGDNIWCVLTSDASCASTTVALSNTIAITVSSSTVLPTINISTASSTICSGSAVFTSTITNGGTSPSYQWKKNGTNVGSNIPTYSPTSLVNGDVISCVLTSNSGCASIGAVSSNSITITVSSGVVSTINISTPSSTICGGSAAFTSTITNGGTSPIYQWKKNGANVGSNIPTYSPTTLVNGDVISCVLTSNAGCSGTSTVSSNSVTIVATSSVAPTISISTTSTTICSGSAVFNSVIANGGTTPVYQWKKNGTNVGSNIPTYSPSTLVNGDEISCELRSNLSCASPTTATSNTITMTVAVCTGVESLGSIENLVSVYPNPSTGILNISVVNLNNYTVTLYDELGRIMLEGANVTTIETSRFTNGIYYLNITSDTSKSVRKIIIAN